MRLQEGCWAQTLVFCTSARLSLITWPRLIGDRAPPCRKMGVFTWTWFLADLREFKVMFRLFSVVFGTFVSYNEE